MDLLQNNQKKPEKTTAQKLVLSLLIISIVLCIIVGILIAYLSLEGENKPYSVVINGKNINLNEIQMFTTENGIRYFPLKTITNNIGYNYYNGEFRIAEESKIKGYINNSSNIVQFFANSKTIYKAKENSNTDYEYYELENPILSSEEILYIAINDLDLALNLILSYSEAKNQQTILSPEYWLEQNSKKYSDANITITETSDNLKALSYGHVINVKDGKYGVFNLNNEEIIGNKYNSMTFCEYTGNFIVSNSNNKYGIIKNDGVANINLQYDSIEVINYKPLLYKVKRLEKFGVIDANGNVINDIIYDSIGYPEDKAKEINYTLIIPNLNENIPESIVVCSDSKYGLIDLETGEQIIECNLNGIYSATEGDKTYYIVELEDRKALLENYIEDLNRVTVNLH